MSIWKKQPSLELINNERKKTMAESLGIEFTAIDEGSITAKMPVDHRTMQPFGYLHGGSSVALAETIGSVAALLCTEEGKRVFGMEINANHLRPVTEGHVHGTGTPIHIGRTTQVWNIDILNDEQKLICVSRITLAVVDISEK